MGDTLQSRPPDVQFLRGGSGASSIGLAAKKLDRRYLAQTAIVFLGYFVAGRLGQAATNIRSSNLGPVWPAYGIAVAATLLLGYRACVGIAAAAFLVAWLSPVPVVTAFGQAVGATLAALVSAVLLRRLTNFDLSLAHLRDALSLVVIGALGSAIVSASIGVSVLFATHQHPYSGLGSAWLIYWLGDGMGVLLVTPLVLTAPALLRLRDRYRLMEFATLILLLTIACVIVLGGLPIFPAEVHVLALVVLPFVMWAAIRFGVSGTALAVLVVATIATIETALGSGPFVINNSFTNGVLLDVFFGVLSITGLSLAVLRSEQEIAQGEREQIVSKQAAMEARLQAQKTLQESEERLRLAIQAGRMYAYQWDPATDIVVRSGGVTNILSSADEGSSLTRRQLLDRVHPDDRALFEASVADRTPENPDIQMTYRLLRPDGSVVWLEKTMRAFFDEHGKLVRTIGMVADIAERKRAEAALVESEEKFRNVFQEAGVGMVIVSPEGRFLGANRTFCDCLGYTEEELLEKTVESVTFSEDWPSFSNKLRESVTEGHGFQCVEKRCLHKSGRIVHTQSSASLIRNHDGDFQYFVGEVLDITKRKVAEEALSGMTRKLIEAQEQERARIGRELHDDINQRLAMLAVSLDQLQDNPSGIRDCLRELRKEVIDISNDIQSLSHDLHSAKLEYLGVVAGIKGWCKEFAERQRVEINFKTDVSSVLPFEAGLSLFRVLQEALHNAIKHSGVKRIDVQLAERPNEVHLIVRDSGKGFDVETAQQSTGLGLTSMRERVRLVNGTIAIESRPMGGTTIHVRVPFSSEKFSESAVG